MVDEGTDVEVEGEGEDLHTVSAVLDGIDTRERGTIGAADPKAVAAAARGSEASPDGELAGLEPVAVRLGIRDLDLGDRCLRACDR